MVGESKKQWSYSTIFLNMAKIFVTKEIPGNHLEKLKDLGHEVLIGEPFDKIANSDALLTLLTDRVDGDLMDAAGPTLKIISNYAVGFDNINVKDATDRGIVITNTPSEEVDEAVAEHTWALISAIARRIVEADEATRRGMYKGWEPDIFLGTSLIGKTLGIIGLGGIGSMVARRAMGYKMNVVYNKHTRDENAEKEMGVKFYELDQLLAESDVVTLHVPLNDETRHMINSDTLSKMKKGAFLVNTARGAVVNERDLVEALRSGHLGGAALDVFDNEPNIDPELIGMPNVITTPHIASATHEARDKMGEMAVGAILDCLSNTKPQSLVNPDVWERRRK